MYRVLHAGFDTLDVSYQGALPPPILNHLREAKEEARASKREQPVEFGPGSFKGVIKPHGLAGGYAFVITNGPTGAIFTIADNADPNQWNLAVSVRALRLLTNGYEATKAWLVEMLDAMGCRITDHSVRRIDFAVDILAPDFELHMDNFVAPAQAKVRPYWSDEQAVDAEGNRPSAVARGRRFESVTIGMMPNRQLIVYDKRRAAIDLKQPYWFDVWQVDRDDVGAQVYRVEIRAGRDALARRLFKRTLPAVEAEMPTFVEDALAEIRYVTDKDAHRNISRATPHPLWELAHDAAENLPIHEPPSLPEGRALEIIGEQRADMSWKQSIGGMINVLILQGLEPEEIAARLAEEMERQALRYVAELGAPAIKRKAEEIKARLAHLIPATDRPTVQGPGS